MSASTPFLGLPTNADWLLATQMALYQSASQDVQAATYLQAWTTPDYVNILNTISGPSMILARFGTRLFVSIGGYGVGINWTFRILPGGLIAGSVGTGNLLPGVQTYADQDMPYVRDDLIAHSGGATLVGHGLGGAIVQAIAAQLTSLGYTVDGVYIAGAPYVGDATFNGFNVNNLYRLQVINDPVIALDPATTVNLFGVFNHFTNPTVFPGVDRSGNASTIDSNGVFFAGSFPRPRDLAVAEIDNGIIINQVPGTYVADLKRSWNPPQPLVPGYQGYAKPWILVDQNAPPPANSLSQAGYAAAFVQANLVRTQQCLSDCTSIPDIVKTYEPQD